MSTAKETKVKKPKDKHAKKGKLSKKDKGSKGEDSLVVDLEKVWWQIKIKTPWSMASQAKPIAVDVLNSRLARAQSLLATQIALYERLNPMSASDRQWMESVEAGGTASDKVSSLLVRLREAPVLRGHQCLGRLLEMARVPARHQAQLALDALLEAFQTLLPAGRPLVSLKQRAFETEPTDQELLVCLFEDSLKRHVLEHVRLLEIQAADQIPHARQQACRHLWQLAMHTAEQQGNIMRLLANKLGDQDRQLASRQLYYLQEIVNKQQSGPEVALQAVEAVRTVIMRPGIGEKPLYYGCLFLSQLTQHPSQPRLTAALMEIYVSLFKGWVVPSLQQQAKAKAATKRAKKHKGKPPAKKEKTATAMDYELNNPERLAKAVITGLHRAIPFCPPAETVKLMESLTSPLEQLIKGPSLATAIQALTLLWTLCQALKQPYDLVLQPLLALLSDPIRLNRETGSHASLMTLIMKIQTEAERPQLPLVKACLRSCLTACSPAWIGAVILMFSELERSASQSLLALTPELPAVSGGGKTFLREATEGCAYELCWLRDHALPCIANWAKAVLEGGLVRLGEGPFEMLAPTRILDQLLQETNLKEAEKLELATKKKAAPAVRVKRKAENEEDFSDYFSDDGSLEDVDIDDEELSD